MLKNVKDGLANHTSHSQASSVINENDDLLDKGIQCDALNCNAEATEKIKLSAGIYGTLIINVCEDCIGIFRNAGCDSNDSC